MLTVGQLAQHLSTLDPKLPIGIIDIDRHPGSQRATITLRVLTDVDVIHEARTGEPQAVWLTAQPSTGQPDPSDGAFALDCRAAQPSLRMPHPHRRRRRPQHQPRRIPVPAPSAQ